MKKIFEIIIGNGTFARNKQMIHFLQYFQYKTVTGIVNWAFVEEGVQANLLKLQ